MTISVKDFIHIINQDANQHEQTLNLNASENHTSQLLRTVLAQHPSYDCYDFPPSGGKILGPWQFSGPTNNQAILSHIALLCESLLGTKQIDVRCKGGQAAEIAILLGLARTGDTVFCVQENDGGHFGLMHIAKHCGINLHPLPFNPESHHIDSAEALKQMEKVWSKASRKIIIINQSFILQQQPWHEFIPAIKNYFSDAIISCDVSHLLGLILGKQLTNPMDYGIDILHASTHKTLPGPQKAIILFNQALDKKHSQSIQEIISPTLQSNCGTAETMGIAIALHEMQVHGHVYAKAVCHHAAVFARELANHGIAVVGKQFDYTETHQCWVTIGDEEMAWKAFATLHDANIRVLPTWLPFTNCWGLRFGSNALTRRGLVESDFINVARWIAQLLSGEKNVTEIKPNIIELAKYFPLNNLKYTLDNLTVS